jgi:hypothetical protein
VKKITLNFSGTGYLTFEQYLLAVVSIASKCEYKFFVDNIDTGIFFNKTLIDTSFDNIAEIQNKLMLDIVPMIKGINDEQREIIIASRTDNNTLMKTICETISERNSLINTLYNKI